jgi:hypothetical protein
MSFKTINGKDESESTKALEQLASTNLLQIESQINLEPEAEMAMNYLASQFPTEYPQDKPENKEKKLTEEEKDKIERDKIL